MSRAEADAILADVVALNGGNQDSLWRVQRRPAWVRHTRWRPGRDDDAPIALADIQVSLLGPRPQKYYRVIYRNRTAEELGRHRLIKLNFMPPHQAIALHTVQIHRGDRIISQLEPFKVRLAPEVAKTTDHTVGLPHTEVEHGPAVILQSELEVGDLLEIEYTVVGIGDPRLEVRSHARFTIPAVTEAADLSRSRLLADPDAPPLEMRRRATSVVPQARRAGGKLEYVWEVKDTPGSTGERDALTMPAVEFSNYGDWETVAELLRPLYPDEAYSEITTIAAELAGKHAEKAAQVRAALDYVQHKIAFSSADLGKWTSEPRPIADTLRRRVGDCKAKSMLLRAILRELGVDSEVVFVNLEGQDLRGMMPEPSKLTHVIVAARVDDREVFMDPTRQGDRGDLWSMPRTDFVSGLSLTPGRGLVEIPHSCDDPEPQTATKLHYHLGAPGQPARVGVQRTVTQLTLEGAERAFRENFGNSSQSEIGANLSGRVGIPHVLGPLRNRDDEKHGAVVLETELLIPEIWRRDADGGPIAKLGPAYMDQDLGWVVTEKRLRHRDWSDAHRVDMIIDLSFDAAVSSDPFEFDLPGFRVTHEVTVRGQQVITRSEVRACSRRVIDPDAILAALPEVTKRMRIAVRPRQ